MILKISTLVAIPLLVVLFAIGVIGIIVIIANVKSRQKPKPSKEELAYKRRVSQALKNVYPDTSKLVRLYDEHEYQQTFYDPLNCVNIPDGDPIKLYTPRNAWLVDDKDDPLYGKIITDIDEYQYMYRTAFYRDHPDLKIDYDD